MEWMTGRTRRKIPRRIPSDPGAPDLNPEIICRISSSNTQELKADLFNSTVLPDLS